MDDIQDIIEEIIQESEVPRLSARIFMQIESYGTDDAKLNMIMLRSTLKSAKLLGYVRVVWGLGEVSRAFPGYWLLMNYKDSVFKLKIGEPRDTYSEIASKAKVLSDVSQIFI
jgi:hypothetical protein